MTASKSARARNARAAARTATANRGGTATTTGAAAGNGTPAKNGTAATGTAAKNGTAATGTAAKNGAAATGTAARNGARTGTAVRDGSGVRDGSKAANGSTADRARADATRAETAGRVGRGGGRAQAVQDETAATGPSLWLQLLTFVLAVAGLGVSTYLTIAHFTESTLAGCAETAGLVDCTKVTTSAQSYAFGIPVAVLGMAFYVFAVVIMSPWAWQARRREIHLARIASLVVGIGFVLYLLYAELFIIGNICLYCTSVHVLTFVLFVLTMFAAAVWGLKPGARFRRRSSQTAE
jgi:uncharacterized membrane protein